MFAALLTHRCIASIMMLRMRSRQKATHRNKRRTHNIRVGSPDDDSLAEADWPVAGMFTTVVLSSIGPVLFVCVPFGSAALSSKGKCIGLYVLFIVPTQKCDNECNY